LIACVGIGEVVDHPVAAVVLALALPGEDISHLIIIAYCFVVAVDIGGQRSSLTISGIGQTAQPVIRQLIAQLRCLRSGFPLHGTDIAVEPRDGRRYTVHRCMVSQRLVEP